MATIERFPRFPSLPPELRRLIWEDALNEEYRDRILMVDQDTHRIIVTRELQQPFRPIFHANRESRKVANLTFPLRLAVYTTGWNNSIDSNMSKGVKSVPDEAVALGEIPVSLNFDHFMIGLGWKKLMDNYLGTVSRAYDHLGSIGKFQTAKLSLEQMGAIRHLIQATEDIPTKAADRDPELNIDFSDSVPILFGGVQVFRSLHLCTHVGAFCLADKMSVQVNAEMIWLWGRTRDDYGPSYNGRTVLHHKHFWKSILTCNDFQKRLQRALPGQE
ncbi:hypothetical protein PG995_006022 [Apiospora arundinis]